MIGNYFKKAFFNKRILFFYLFSYVYILYQLYIYRTTQYVDITIVSANTVALTINQVFIFYIIRRNKYISQIKDYILVRINKDHLINQFIKLTLIESVIQIFIIYIIPIIIFSSNISSLIVYGIFVFCMLLLFIFYQFIEIIAMFIHNKIINFVLLCMPFIFNLIIQIFCFTKFYELVGGLL
jgi:hypothetical protein